MKLSGIQSGLPLTMLAGLLAMTCLKASAQQQRPLLLDTSELRVTVRNTTGMPVSDAKVVMHVIKMGNDLGAMEVRTDGEGKVEQDIVPLGNVVRLQVSAPGFKSFNSEYPVNAISKNVVIRLKDQPIVQTAMVEAPADLPKDTAPSTNVYKEAQWVHKSSHSSLKKTHAGSTLAKNAASPAHGKSQTIAANQ